MKSLLTVASLITGAGVLFQQRYRILNALMAVGSARKFLVSASMKVPFIRKKMLPSILGRPAS